MTFHQKTPFSFAVPLPKLRRMSLVTVDLAERSYPIHIAADSLNSIGDMLISHNLQRHVAVITDSNVQAHYAARVTTALTAAGLRHSLHVVTAGEASKSLSCAESLCREMTRAGHDRQSLVLALGGGVVGDLAGFVAAIFYRGIPLVQVPTTIVSMVDSSIGGKTGVNIAEGKNLVGAFHQPRLVVVDPRTLLSLAEREWREGMAEVIKHAAIRDVAMLAELEQITTSRHELSADLIARNLAIKARIVEADEHETRHIRALLNFGHTIGHGIEASVPYGSLLHGEAVALGIRAALWLSEHHSSLSSDAHQRVLRLIQRFELPLVLPDSIDTPTILDKMARDKKFVAGSLRFVLLSALGEACVSTSITPEAVIAAIEHLRTPLD